MTANWKITLAILTANTVLMSASYTMLIPFLPMYLIQELGVAQGDVNWWSSAIFSVTFLISGIMAPIWGAMADKNSRKLMCRGPGSYSGYVCFKDFQQASGLQRLQL